MNMGAQMVKEVAFAHQRTNAGDAPPPPTGLAQAIVREGMKYVAAGMNPMDLKRGIDKAFKPPSKSSRRLPVLAPPTKEIAQVGAISANSDYSTASRIAEAMEKVGKEGSSPWRRQIAQ